uniref:C2H2-type domain-containing protein n=1 Tax=Timema genevievae TaxID=629358 RepID=A0A7R9PR65_TIMGE|nr:unnamed protein product [Timema genevievae]
MFDVHSTNKINMKRRVHQQRLWKQTSAKILFDENTFLNVPKDKFLEEKRNCKLMGQKENIFLNDSALGENGRRSGPDIIEEKHINLFKNVYDFKDFTSKHNNTKPNLIYTLPIKYMCNVCNKDFKEMGRLNKHLLVHSKQRKYKCDVCDNSFKINSNLNRHLLIHSEQRKCKCDVCDNSFKIKSNLNRHLLIHSGLRKYKCDVCDNSFKIKSNLNRHLLIHSEQRKCKCDVCDKIFKDIFPHIIKTISIIQGSIT